MMQYQEEITAQLRIAVQQAQSSYHRLVVLVDNKDQFNNDALNVLCNNLNYGYLNIGICLGQELAKLNKEHRSLKASGVLDDILQAVDFDCIILNRLDILFEPTLQLKPFAILERLSRNKSIIVCWPGKYDGENLSYSETGRKDYFSTPQTNLILIELPVLGHFN